MLWIFVLYLLHGLSFLFLLYLGIFLNIISIGGEQGLRNTSGTIKVVVGIIDRASHIAKELQHFSREKETAIKKIPMPAAFDSTDFY